MELTRQTLVDYLHQYLNVDEFEDYGPNNLQIEGKDNIKKMAFAVSATRDSITKAVDWGADALIVHHGLFWKLHGAKAIVGPFAKRIAPLIKNNINLLGFHLPLDAHPEIGNAATLGRYLELTKQAPFCDQRNRHLGIQGILTKKISARDLQEKLKNILNHPVLMACEDPQKDIQSIGIITGGANSHWEDAASLKLDAYITGEMSEHDWHESQEAGVAMFAGGHHATERFGIIALKEHLQKKYQVDGIFFDSNNPA